MIDVVIPTIGRASLAILLESLARSRGPRPAHLVVVDDRPDRTTALPLPIMDEDMRARTCVVPGSAAGPASARNIGWRWSRARWIAFLDDDVIVDDDWLGCLADDLALLPADVAGSQGRVHVPLPHDRRPTDWERNVAALQGALWITADCAYRRSALLAAGGFDERFARAYREDADLALRITARGGRIVRGSRRIAHPVRPAPWWISVHLQAGNADDAFMDALHGTAWRARASAPRGAFRTHVATVAAALLAATALVARRPVVARSAFAVWAVQTAVFALRRIAPGPRSPREIAGLLATSAAIPFAAVYHRVRGTVRARALLADRERAPHPLVPAVLFDRDGTLIVDVPDNTDPARVEPMPGARAALERLRSAGVLTAVITNQGGVARGSLTLEDVAAINARTEALLGPLGPILCCTHGPQDRCGCRKPAPGLIEAAARALDVCARDCVVVGDIGADLEAARAAGARAILVPTGVTLAEEIEAAPLRAGDLAGAVDAILGGAA